MAPTNASGMKNKSPQTRLVVAFPLVSAGVVRVAGAMLVATDTAEATAVPQTLQNRSSVATLLPQAAQNDPIASPARKLHETLHRALRGVNAQMESSSLPTALRFDKVRLNGFRDPLAAFLPRLCRAYARNRGLLSRLRTAHGRCDQS